MAETETLAPWQTAIELAGHSPAAERLGELVRRAARTEGSVLVVGEAGTDREAIARELVRERRAGLPLVEVDCADQAASLDRELFGSSTEHGRSDLESVSADSRVAAARGGTLILHDVTELPASSQARLARMARDREVRIAGAPIPIAMRMIATAMPAIDGDVRDGRFRADLFRRLAASRIDVPALRDRAEDVPGLAERLLAEATADSAPRVFTQAALALIAALSWPGNLAELRSVVMRAALEPSVDGTVQVEHVLPALNLGRAALPFAPAGSLREARQRFERDYIASVLQHHGWRMAEAAQTLGIQRPNLYRKARQLGIPVVRTAE